MVIILISKLDITFEVKVLDPCCGTGNYYLQLPNNVPIDKHYGNDIDSITLKITRLKIAKKYDCIFFNAAKVIESSKVDSLHLMPEAHKKLAEELYKCIMENE